MDGLRQLVQTQAGSSLAMKPYTSGARLHHHLRRNPASSLHWSLRCHSVAVSTEQGLSHWLRDKPWTGEHPRALIAARQIRAHGQGERIWQSPRGGVWISAALPWPVRSRSVALFGLIVALALAERLEQYGLPVRIKWPNDLVVGSRKLVGLLPSLVHRGNNLRLARIGLGMNIVNPVPVEGVGLAQLLPQVLASPEAWVVEVLLALEHAILLSRCSVVWLREQIESRLWSTEVQDPESHEIWAITGISALGELRLQRDNKHRSWTRWR